MAKLPASLARELERVVGWAVNPADGSVDWGPVVAVCTMIQTKPECSQAVLDLLLIKMQSTSTTIAISAFTVMEACVKHCGSPMHTIIGKFKFLNELIKISNPKFKSKAPLQLQHRILVALRQWAHSLPHKTKIQEAFIMMIQQGVHMPGFPQPPVQVAACDQYTDTPAPVPPPTPASTSPSVVTSSASALTTPKLSDSTTPITTTQPTTSNSSQSTNLLDFDLTAHTAITTTSNPYEDTVPLSTKATISTPTTTTPSSSSPPPSSLSDLLSFSGLQDSVASIKKKFHNVMVTGVKVDSNKIDTVVGPPAFHDGFIFIGKRDTEHLLMGYEAGAYLIRESSTVTGTYTLAVRDHNSVEHFRIKLEQGKLFIAGSQHRFQRLDDLVKFYQGTNQENIVPVQLHDGIYGMYRQPVHEEELTPPTSPLTTPLSVTSSSRNTTADPDDVWELARKDLLLGDTLGVGNFGEVSKAKLRVPWGGEIEVAVKMTKANRMTAEAFLSEAAKLKQLQHKHIVRVYGLCTTEDPIFIVFEYLASGSLLDFLKSRKGRNLSLVQQTRLLRDIASGMSFLETNHWIHADLAARNLLVGEKLQVKICDFGHAIKTDDDNTPVRNAITIPIRWSAPEFYNTIACSPKSDVWSFGVVVFEVLSRAMAPYAEMDGQNGFDNKTLIAMLMCKYRMQRVKCVPLYFYHLMLDCWHPAPKKRPSFRYLLQVLSAVSKCDKLKEDKGSPSLIDQTGLAHGYDRTGETYVTRNREAVKDAAAKILLDWHNEKEKLSTRRGAEMAQSMQHKSLIGDTTSSALAHIYDEPEFSAANNHA